MLSVNNKICVCVALYNGEKFIQHQLRSILKQLPPDARVLISDDKSSDDSVAKVLELNDRRIEVLQGPGAGVTKNFEYLLKRVDEDYVFLADQDDEWLPGRIRIMMNSLMKNDLVYIDGEICDSELVPCGKALSGWRRSRTGFFANLYRNSFIGCTMAFRSSLLKKVLPIPESVTMHDQWIGLIAELNGTTEFINEMGILYRRHGNNVTGLTSDVNIFQKVANRLRMLRLVVFRSYFGR